ncbi:MAG: hypothetical protein EAZ85_10305 [Bacteroidetes bacterium]|nr:MAG: hypothetical protein EAZ85_10305 [Bacteroidota bacterium]TAG92784.1 MAG: hypothetical protein EAZ20_02195 [Bacteroidota bacterium]
MKKESINIWGIEEYEGDGVSCPIIPKNLPWHKKVVLTFFRFGVCPLCVTMSLTYSVGKVFKKILGINKKRE